MDEGQLEGALLGVDSEEHVLYKTGAGIFDGLDFMPNSIVVVTDRRVLIADRTPFSVRRRSVYHSKIASMDVKKTVTGSRLVINVMSNGRKIGASTMNFRNPARALSVFGMISSVIASRNDPSHYTAAKHKLLHDENTYEVEPEFLGTYRMDASSPVDFARSESRKAKRQVRRAQSKQYDAFSMQQEKKAEPVANASSAIVQTTSHLTESVASAPRSEDSIAANSIINGAAPAGYYNMPFVPAETELKLEGFKPASTLGDASSAVRTGAKPKPEDMKIFRIRKIRAAHAANQEEGWLGKLNPFNIFKTE